MSTAMMYAFDQRPQCAVVDEPFYARYLQRHEVNHPGRDEVLASMSTDAASIIQQHFCDPGSGREVFIKNMAHHMDGLDLKFLRHCTNFLLIRHPARTIASYTKVVKAITLRDLALEQQLQQWQALKAMGAEVHILDSSDLLRNPAVGMQQLCRALGIGYDPNMLSWSAGPRAADGTWAKYWYGGVHGSTGIEERVADLPDVAPGCQAVHDAAMGLYEVLWENRMVF